MSTHDFIKLYEKLIGGGKPTAALISQAANAAPSKGVKRAVMVGINYFGSSCELKGCLNDIINATAYFKSIGYTEFVILVDSPDDRKFKNPDCPTRANILKALKGAVAKCKKGDQLAFWYSGHGSSLANQTGQSDETDRADECICPCDYEGAASSDPDAGFIRDDELNKILVDSLPEGVSLRAIFDCCHSGTILDLPYSFISNTRTVQETKAVVNRDIWMISGCRDPETSADAFIEGRASGALTWALLKALSDIRLSGVKGSTTTWKELIKEVRVLLLRGRYEQIPLLGLDSKERAESRIDLL